MSVAVVGSRESVEATEKEFDVDKEVAVGMTKHIKLERIPATDLAAIVRPSGLVEPSLLMDAFQAHAFQRAVDITKMGR